MTESLSGGARKFYTLDLMRGLAALAVVSFHLRPLLGAAAFKEGYLAVDLFFMMSGVVIDYSYRARLLDQMSTGQFLVKRLIRLSPLNVFALLIGTVIASLGILVGTGNWSVMTLAIGVVAAILFIPIPIQTVSGNAFPLNPPTWSLSLEIFINIIYAVCARFLSTTVLRIVVFVSGAVLISVALQHGDLDSGFLRNDFYYGFPRVLFGFTVGVLIARSPLMTLQRVSSGFHETIIVVALLTALYFPLGAEFSRGLWDSMCVVLLFPLLTAMSVVYNPPSWLRSTSSFLGLTSYAVYIVHGPLLLAINKGFEKFPILGKFSMISEIMVFALLLVLGFLLDTLFDTPVRRKLTGWLSRLEPGSKRPVAP